MIGPLVGFITDCISFYYIIFYCPFSARCFTHHFFLLDVKSQKFFIFFFWLGYCNLAYPYQWKSNSTCLLIIKICLKLDGIISFYKLKFKLLTKSVIRRFRHVRFVYVLTELNKTFKKEENFIPGLANPKIVIYV